MTSIYGRSLLVIFFETFQKRSEEEVEESWTHLTITWIKSNLSPKIFMKEDSADTYLCMKRWKDEQTRTSRCPCLFIFSLRFPYPQRKIVQWRISLSTAKNCTVWCVKAAARSVTQGSDAATSRCLSTPTVYGVFRLSSPLHRKWLLGHGLFCLSASICVLISFTISST